ncbi:uncharacterized protein [Pithys albifrons albifrons]|uniref:uncharacterized protein isoform X2 n=1 Tax=Pithys albifrons albifrons TaxID=3385563 RepID=UPI003A5CADBD
MTHSPLPRVPLPVAFPGVWPGCAGSRAELSPRRAACLGSGPLPPPHAGTAPWCPSPEVITPVLPQGGNGQPQAYAAHGPQHLLQLISRLGTVPGDRPCLLHGLCSPWPGRVLPCEPPPCARTPRRARGAGGCGAAVCPPGGDTVRGRRFTRSRRRDRPGLSRRFGRWPRRSRPWEQLQLGRGAWGSPAMPRFPRRDQSQRHHASGSRPWLPAILAGLGTWRGWGSRVQEARVGCGSLGKKAGCRGPRVVLLLRALCMARSWLSPPRDAAGTLQLQLMDGYGCFQLQVGSGSSPLAVQVICFYPRLVSGPRG